MRTFASGKILLEFGRIDVEANDKPSVAVLFESPADCTRSVLESGIVDHISVSVRVVLTNVELAKALRFQRTQTSFYCEAEFFKLFPCDRLLKFGTRVRVIRLGEGVVVDGCKQLVDRWG